MKYNYFIALDFSQANMAIAYSKDGKENVKMLESMPTIRGLKQFCSSSKGQRC
jgi:hypothetical protein